MLRAYDDVMQVEAGLTDLQQAYDQLHKDLAGARGADERRTLEQHVRSTPRSHSQHLDASCVVCCARLSMSCEQHD